MPDAAEGLAVDWNGTAIPFVQNISWDGLNAATIDVSSLADTVVPRITAGLSDAGQVSIEIFHEPANTVHNAILDDCVTPASRVIALTWPDAGSTLWTANAYCTEFTPGGTVKETLTATMTFDITGLLSP